jgi:hypothetical protein
LDKEKAASLSKEQITKDKIEQLTKDKAAAILRATGKESEDEIFLLNQKFDQQISGLQEELAQEENALAVSLADKADKYAEDTRKAQEEHDKKLAAYQTALNEELAILNRHADDVARVGERVTTDDITELETKYAKEKAKAEEQHQDKLKDITRQAQEATGAWNGNFNPNTNFTPSVDTSNVANEAKNAGKMVGDEFQKGLNLSILQSSRNGKMSPVSSALNASDLAAIVGKAFNIGAAYNGNLNTGGIVGSNGIQHFAYGGIVPGVGGTDTVPAMLTPGEVVLNPARGQGMGGTTVNIYNPSVRDDSDITDIVTQIKRALGRDLELARMGAYR